MSSKGESMNEELLKALKVLNESEKDRRVLGAAVLVFSFAWVMLVAFWIRMAL